MAIGRYLLPFAAGFAAGALVQKNWPKIVEVGGPLARKALAQGSTLFERGRQALGEQSERFSDLVAEVREEEALKAKGQLPEGTPPASPTPA